MLAQGGLQIPHDTPASRASLLDDMRRSARISIDERRARLFVSRILETIKELEDRGLELDRDTDGSWQRRMAGGLSEPRIVSSADQIGPAVMRILRKAVDESPAEVRTNHRVVDLEPRDSFVRVIAENNDGQTVALDGAAVVICTGGRTFHHAQESGQRSTNLPNGNQYVYELVRTLGVEEMHERYFQYQPFGLVMNEGGLDKCVPETIVNHSVRLLDRTGREVGSVNQDRLDLSETMFQTLEEGVSIEAARGPALRLTLSDIRTEVLKTDFPNLWRLLERRNWINEDVLVWPFLHYQLGGFRISPDGATSVPGLYLAGEITGGIHGRNRLMGNGFTDSLVHGRVAGKSAASWATTRVTGE